MLVETKHLETTMTTLALPEAHVLAPDAQLRFEEALLRIARTVFRPSPGAAGRMDKAGYVTLARLGHCGAVRLSDLAATMDLDLSTVSRQVKNLEAIGMVARCADPADRRAAVVDLTADGRRELARQREQRFQTLTSAFAALPARDRDRLVHLLDQLASHLPDSTCAATTAASAAATTTPTGATR